MNCRYDCISNSNRTYSFNNLNYKCPCNPRVARNVQLQHTCPYCCFNSSISSSSTFHFCVLGLNFCLWKLFLFFCLLNPVFFENLLLAGALFPTEAMLFFSFLLTEENLVASVSFYYHWISRKFFNTEKKGFSTSLSITHF